MAVLTEKPVGVIYEHASQFNPVLNELSKRGIPWTVIDAADHSYDPLQTELPYRVIFNDMSNPLYTYRSAAGVAHVLDYTRHLEQVNIPRIQGRLLNGSYATGVLANKSRQLSVFASQGVLFPATRVVNSISQLLAASSELQFPLLIRANRSWSDLPPLRFDSIVELIEAVADNRIYLDRTDSILVQSYIHPRQDHVVRVETINGRAHYAVKTYIAGDRLHAWPLEVKTELYRPGPEILHVVEQLARAARLDVGAIEYITDRRTNKMFFLSIRAHAPGFSTIVEDMDFHPAIGVADYITNRLLKVREMELSL